MSRSCSVLNSRYTPTASPPRDVDSTVSSQSARNTPVAPRTAHTQIDAAAAREPFAAHSQIDSAPRSQQGVQPKIPKALIALIALNPSLSILVAATTLTADIISLGRLSEVDERPMERGNNSLEPNNLKRINLEPSNLNCPL